MVVVVGRVRNVDLLFNVRTFRYSVDYMYILLLKMFCITKLPRGFDSVSYTTINLFGNMIWKSVKLHFLFIPKFWIFKNPPLFQFCFQL